MKNCPLLLAGLLLTSSLTAAEDPWERLQLGMSGSETVALLGEPVLSSRGGGFHKLNYDGGAEVLLYGDGRVVGWTAPAGSRGAKHSHDIWSCQPAGKYYATMHAILPRPVRDREARTVRQPAGDRAATAGTGYEEYSARRRAG
jgi:hypothetical protein